MEIVAFQPNMAGAVARCYSETVAAAPYCEPVDGSWFCDLKRLARQPLIEEQLLVAHDGDNVPGFVHVGVAAPAAEEWHIRGEPGVIRFLSHRPGERAAGVGLLEAAEDWLRERDRAWIVAGDSRLLYPFYYVPFAHLSEKITHLPPLFGMAGYVQYESEVLFEWRDFEAPEVAKPEFDCEAAPEWREQVDTFGPGVACYAKRAEKTVGECMIARLGSEQWRPELADWCFCTSVYVDEPHQGKGLGKWLLSLSLREMRVHGLRHAMVSTDWNNHRAYLFYANFGFRFLDRTFSFRKELPRT